MGRLDDVVIVEGRGRLDEETPAQTWTQANLVTEIRVHASREILALCTSCSKSQCHTYTAICRKLVYFSLFLVHSLRARLVLTRCRTGRWIILSVAFPMWTSAVAAVHSTCEWALCTECRENGGQLSVQIVV